MSLLATSARCLRPLSFRGTHLSPLAPSRRSFATKYTECRNGYISLERSMDSRRSQARRSLLVQVGTQASCGDLVSYCEQFGVVEGVHHYSLDSGGQHYMLVEFKEEADVDVVLNEGSCHRRDVDCNPIRTPFLWFKADGKKLKPCNEVKLLTTDGCRELKEEELIQQLQECDSVSHQIQVMHDRLSLNDLGVRLRYMVARQVEMAFSNLHANIAVKPFGSSVNGFGKMGCDLDLVLTNCLEEDSKSSPKRLVYHSKKWSGGPAEQWRRHLELAGDVLRLCVPGCARVRHILQARIPIIKYTHELTGVECDLCAANLSGVYMSELLYLYGCLDSRVRPLVCAVRRWAETVGLTSSSPGPWITNFPLSLMVLFFLQRERGSAILPPLQYLIDKAGKEDIRITEDQINCTFLRDLNKIPYEDYNDNDTDLGSLLLQFFEFYSNFDFEDQAISIITGRAVKKPSHTALYIVNPLEKTLNVSRNVSFKECERLKLEVRNAAWILENNLDREKKGAWGLVELVEKKSMRAIKDLVRAGNSQRLITMSDLFSDETEFKSAQVETQVKKIKQEGKSAIEEARRKILKTNVEPVKRTARKR